MPRFIIGGRVRGASDLAYLQTRLIVAKTAAVDNIARGLAFLQARLIPPLRLVIAAPNTLTL